MTSRELALALTNKRWELVDLVFFLEFVSLISDIKCFG